MLQAAEREFRHRLKVYEAEMAAMEASYESEIKELKGRLAAFDGEDEHKTEGEENRRCPEKSDEDREEVRTLRIALGAANERVSCLGCLFSVAARKASRIARFFCPFFLTFSLSKLLLDCSRVNDVLCL